MIALGLGCAAAAAVVAAAAARRSPIPGRLGLAPRPGRHGLAALGRRLPRTPSLLAERLNLLGRGDELDRLRGMAALCAVGGGAIGVAISGGVLAGLAAGPIAAAAGWRLPAFLLARAAGSRRERLADEVSNLVDLVAIGLSAGLTPRLAFDRAVDHLKEPLAAPLARLRREVSLGATWIGGLDVLGERLGLPDLRRLASTLGRATRLGAPATEPLRALARDVRAEREAALEARARRAPVTMLFPLVLCILPAFVLAAVLPAMLVATQGVP